MYMQALYHRFIIQVSCMIFLSLFLFLFVFFVLSTIVYSGWMDQT